AAIGGARGDRERGIAAQSAAMPTLVEGRAARDRRAWPRPRATMTLATAAVMNYLMPVRPEEAENRSPLTSARRLALRRPRLLDQPDRVRRVGLAVETHHHRELLARGLGHEEVDVDAGLAQGARHPVPDARLVVAADEKRGLSRRAEARAAGGRGCLR